MDGVAAPTALLLLSCPSLIASGRVGDLLLGRGGSGPSSRPILGSWGVVSTSE